MARIRTVKPEIWTDEKFVELSAFARLVFIGLWNFSDDEGRMVCSYKRIKMQILPSDSVDISEILGEIRREKMIEVYTVEDKQYIQIKNFCKHQKIDKRTRSKLPPPPNSPEFPQIAPTDQGRDQGKDISSLRSDNNPHTPRRGGGEKTSHEVTFDFEKRTFLNITDADMETWSEAYPAVDVRAEIRKIAAWLVANPKNKKTNYKRFINNWLSKQQDRGAYNAKNQRGDGHSGPQRGREKHDELRDVLADMYVPDDSDADGPEQARSHGRPML